MRREMTASDKHAVTYDWFVSKMRCRTRGSDRLAILAMVELFKLQTPDERGGVTAHRNGVGFNKFDAKFGCRMARLWLSGKMPLERFTSSELDRCRNLAFKYRKQLVPILVANIEAMKEQKAPPTLRSPRNLQIERNRKGARKVLVAIEAA